MNDDRELPTRTQPEYRIREASGSGAYAFPLLSGLEQLLNIQKATLEMYARQTTAAINMMQQFFPMIPSACVNAAERGVIELLRVQTGALDFIGSRFSENLNASAAGHPVSMDSTRLQEVLRDSADQFLAIHRKLVDVFVQQLQCFSALFRGPGEEFVTTSGSDLLSAIQTGSQEAVQAQMRFWQLWLNPFQTFRTDQPRDGNS